MRGLNKKMIDVGYMAILKPKKIREMQQKDVEEKLKELQLEFSKEKASSNIGGTVKNPGRLKEIRRTIARIKTITAQKTRKGE